MVVFNFFTDILFIDPRLIVEPWWSKYSARWAWFFAVVIVMLGTPIAALSSKLFPAEPIERSALYKRGIMFYLESDLNGSLLIL